MDFINNKNNVFGPGHIRSLYLFFPLTYMSSNVFLKKLPRRSSLLLSHKKFNERFVLTEFLAICLFNIYVLSFLIKVHDI